MEAGLRRLLVLAAVAAAALGGCGKSGGSAGAPGAPPDAKTQAILDTLPPAYRHADLDNGQAKFAQCKACHTVVQGGPNMVGPDLWGVFGRKAGTAPGFSYSSGVKGLGFAWDADKIDHWIANPRAMVPDTHMTFLGLDNPKDRIDVVAYLKVASTTPSQ
jgi:cytochrome c